MDIVITVIVLIVMLGILISTHELGHLLVAKAFNVYCLEYAIGFGPKLFSWKTKKGETVYSVRAIPLGGFVSMYEEGVELPDGQDIPKERCLSHIKPWQKSLVMLAGITVNFITCIIFTMIYTCAFPNYYQSESVRSGYTVEGTKITAEMKDYEEFISYGLWADGTIGDQKISSNSSVMYVPEIAVDSKNNQIGYVIDSEALINGEKMVAVYLYENIKENDLLNTTTFYYAKSGFTPTAFETQCGIKNKADTDRGAYKLTGGDTLELHLTFLSIEKKDARPQDWENRNTYTYTTTSMMDENGSYWVDHTITLGTLKYWAPFGERVGDGFKMIGYYFQSIGLGLKAIFSFDFGQVGSVVAMGSVLNQSSTVIGWGRTFFLYGGFLGLNLAILNLLPFPGLDGYQLLVVIVEKISKKKIPDKVKGIISIVGIGLLLVFGVCIIIKDIIGLF